MYQEQPCDQQNCTEPIACHENPYCAAAMRECTNVECDVKTHSDASPNDQDHYWEDGCTPADFTEDGLDGQWTDEDGNVCTPVAAEGHFHVRVSHTGWTNTSTNRE